MKQSTKINPADGRWLAQPGILIIPALALALLAHAPFGRAQESIHTPRLSDLPSPICDKVNVPEGHRLSTSVYAIGVQIYRWNGTSWVFIAPEAGLYSDPCHQGLVGTHYGGPIWEAVDGSRVAGARLEGCTPDRGAVPWLLLKATPLSDHGRFAEITFIQRLNTIGGTAPAEAGAFVGDEARVPYTTEYYFYRSIQN